ncbi:MAG: polyribonucleotide nucleotidyltransferase [Minisyncoccales bacterium]
MDSKTYKINTGGKDLIVEIRDLAEQANGSVLVRYGDTMVLATAVMSEQEREGIDFFPLTVDYEERYYAAGKIYGSRYIRRESRPSDEAILTARLIDRAIRPKFPKNLKREVQVVITCLSWDSENDPDILGLLGASLALSISDIPWAGPIANLRIGKNGQKFILNPTYKQREQSDIDFFLAGGIKGEQILIDMIEGEAKETKEKTFMEAYKVAISELKKLIEFQQKIIKENAEEKVVIERLAVELEWEKEIKEFLGNKLEKTLTFSDNSKETKKEKNKALNELREDLIFFIKEQAQDGKKIRYAKDFFEEETERIIHKNILEKESRPDGRKLDEIRNIYTEVGLLPRTHGSGLFVRGETKSLSILTLGAPSDQRLLEGMEIVGKKRFMHHYNFPPYSVGEVRPMRGPGRREVGHGMLAEKALLSLIPDSDTFPYTIRIVSEILSSNGSTSMASISSSSMALMDAGVPLKSLATGIAMGLITEINKQGEITNYKILTDIQGPEDHYGDMDLKVAGTKNGITALQMDVKITGVTEKILEDALVKAKEAREYILSQMEKVLAKPREKLSPWAPRIYTIQIKPEKIREVIGPGGKVINEIIEKCEVSIDIEDDGRIFITAEKEDAAEKAVAWIKNITREVKVGEVFQGKVKRIMNFGAFVEILPGQEGLVHISKLAKERVEKVEDVVKIGDIVPVKVILIDEQGRINLSLENQK